MLNWKTFAVYLLDHTFWSFFRDTHAGKELYHISHIEEGIIGFNDSAKLLLSSLIYSTKVYARQSIYSSILLTTSLDIERTPIPRVLRETEYGSEDSSEKTAFIVPLDKTVPELITVHIR